MIRASPTAAGRPILVVIIGVIITNYDLPVEFGIPTVETHTGRYLAFADVIYLITLYRNLICGS